MKTHFDLNTGKMEPGEGDPALAGAHCRPDIEREIDRNMKRIHKEEAAQRKEDTLRTKCLRREAKILLEAGLADAVYRAQRCTTAEPRSRVEAALRSQAWFHPVLVIDLACRLGVRL